MQRGDHFTKINDNGTILSGIILSVFQNLKNRKMYIAQRPEDMLIFCGYVTNEEKAIELVSSKY